MACFSIPSRIKIMIIIFIKCKTKQFYISIIKTHLPFDRLSRITFLIRTLYNAKLIMLKTRSLLWYVYLAKSQKRRYFTPLALVKARSQSEQHEQYPNTCDTRGVRVLISAPPRGNPRSLGVRDTRTRVYASRSG